METKVFFVIIIASLLLLSFHETGHYICAKIMKLPIEKVSFSFTPFPRLYISVYDSGISMCKRLIYLFSGCVSTVLIFVLLHFVSFEYSNELLMVTVAQMLIETNPFYSDFSFMFFLCTNRKKISSFSAHVYHDKQREEMKDALSQLRETYFLSSTWYSHFMVWTVFLIVMLKKYCNHNVL